MVRAWPVCCQHLHRRPPFLVKTRLCEGRSGRSAQEPSFYSGFSFCHGTGQCHPGGMTLKVREPSGGPLGRLFADEGWTEKRGHGFGARKCHIKG